MELVPLWQFQRTMRDYAFAKKFDLDIISVIEHDEEGVYTGDGKHVHSDFLNGLNNQDKTLSKK